MRLFRALPLLGVMLASAFSLDAITLSQDQINQFKSLTPQQKQALAGQLGVDLSGMGGGLGQRPGAISDPMSGNTNMVYPRGTSFDEYGNPVVDQALLNPFEEGADELRLYGLELFANAPSTFSPVANTPIPANYILGPGDQLQVTYFGKENNQYFLEINHDGALVLPKLGPIQLAGKTFSEAKAYVSDVIGKKITGVEVSLTMGMLRTIRIFVMGEAHKPGTYNISSLSSITHALFVSGGVTDIASLRNIQLKRAGKLVETLDLYDLLNSGDASKDVLLQPGDVVFIPSVSKTVTVEGLVRRPAIYELKNEQSLSQVIELAGGKLPEGYEKAIHVKRFLNGTQLQLTVDLTKEDIDVKAGDEIRIAKVSSHVANAVSLIGAVARPGNYQWSEGMKLTSLLNDRKSDLLQYADMNYQLILREKNNSGDIEVIQADLNQILSGQSSDPILHANDKILVFSRFENESFSDMTLDDLSFTSEEIAQYEMEKWQAHFEERAMWAELSSPTKNEPQILQGDNQTLVPAEPLFELSEQEKEKVNNPENDAYFTRKSLLAPVFTKLREQARLGEPLQLVEIVGEVKVPGVYPLTQNATVLDLIKAAGGLTESSYGHNSEITRTVINQKGIAEVTHVNFSPADVLSRAQGANIDLQSKDRINIFTIPSWQENLRVTVKGEVEFPGEYTIRRGETMSDLLKRVGGLTAYGEAEAAIFTRESLKEKETENLHKIAEELRKQIASESLRRQAGAGAIVSYDEARKLLSDLTSVEPVGRLVIDLASVVRGETGSDVVLEDGDALYIPGRTQSVNVIGEVYVPTSHLFTDGIKYNDYILKSGGYKELAAKEKTYVIHVDGSVSVPGKENGFWFSNSQSVGIKPGDTIVVPFDSSHVDNMTLWTNASQILYQMAVAVAAIGSL